MADAARTPPPYSGAITFFYYDNLEAAVCWYRDVIGFEPAMVEDWMALFQVTPAHRLGLVAAAQGSQSPVTGPNKGAMLSLETDCLEDWYRRFRDAGVEGLDAGFQPGCRGRTTEFRVRDPGGYHIEFFCWVAPAP
jgi:catechol 2,3-dioxygenase-like lactoylglutathione lyase family enzyme